MKPQQSKELIKSILERGWIKDGDVYRTPAEAAALGLNKSEKKPRQKPGLISGWIDDYRNIKNKASHRDEFIMLIECSLKVDIWPEFYFSTERLFRFDYAIPEFKIGIEQEGGIWAKGNSGHSSGTGIMRDMEKSNLAQSLGWSVIRRTPTQMKTDETLDMIRKFIAENSKVFK